jgi:hypothetical protein
MSLLDWMFPSRKIKREQQERQERQDAIRKKSAEVTKRYLEQRSTVYERKRQAQQSKNVEVRASEARRNDDAEPTPAGFFGHPMSLSGLSGECSASCSAPLSAASYGSSDSYCSSSSSYDSGSSSSSDSGSSSCSCD